jgi:succinate dehydrogenase / fumarate reductase iron-sulfur subunit
MTAGSPPKKIEPVPAQRVRLAVKRSAPDRRGVSRRFDVFEVEVRRHTTIADALAAISRDPVLASGERVAAVAWETGCLQGLCGACTVRVDGVARLACTTLLTPLATKKTPLRLEPLSTFPVIADLVVDRSRLFRDLARMEPEAGAGSASVAHEDVAGGRDRAAAIARAELLARCTGCAACLDACPEYGDDRAFVGAAVLARVERRKSLAPSPAQAKRHVELAMRDGGIQDCSKSGNCEVVCPEGLPLLDALRALAKDANRELFDTLTGKDR